MRSIAAGSVSEPCRKLQFRPTTSSAGYPVKRSKAAFTNVSGKPSRVASASVIPELAAASARPRAGSAACTARGYPRFRARTRRAGA